MSWTPLLHRAFISSTCSSNPRPSGSLVHICDDISIEKVTDIAQNRRHWSKFINSLDFWYRGVCVAYIYLICVVLSKYNAFHTYLEYLEVSSLLKRSNCYDTPQVTIHSHPSTCTVVLGLPRPLCDIAHPGLFPSSFPSRAMGQEAVMSLDVAVSCIYYWF